MADEKITASELVFKSVYKVSEDMLGLVHKIVSDNSKYEAAFKRMAAALEDINKNLRKYVIDKKTFDSKTKKNVERKAAQSKELVNLCLSYSARCRALADEMIRLTQGLEKNRKMKEIINNMVKKLEEETKLLEENQEEDDEDPLESED